MASEGTESGEAAADDGAAAMDQQGGQGGLESDWKVPPAPAAAGVPQSEVESSLDKKRSRMEETQRRLAAEMAAVQAEEARIEQEERMKKERIEAEAARIEAEAARIEQEKKMEKERIEQEKKMERERIEEAQIESYPTPRMVVRDVIDYKVVEGPLDHIQKNEAGGGIFEVDPSWLERAQKQLKKEYPQSLRQQISFLSQQGYEVEHNLIRVKELVYQHVSPPVIIYSKGMVKYGPPRWETPYLWNKAEERIKLEKAEAESAAEAQRSAEKAEAESAAEAPLRSTTSGRPYPVANPRPLRRRDFARNKEEQWMKHNSGGRSSADT